MTCPWCGTDCFQREEFEQTKLGPMCPECYVTYEEMGYDEMEDEVGGGE